MAKAQKPTPPEEAARLGTQPSSVRAPLGKPLISRRVWVLGTDPGRIAAAQAALTAAGHQVQTADTMTEIPPALKEFRPDLIVIDLQDQPERGRHIALQLRADRATRQLPIVLAGARPPKDADADKADRTVTGPTRRYMRSLDHPTVLRALVVEL